MAPLDFSDSKKPSEILLLNMVEDYRRQGGVCSISGSVYCTAWVSMVSKPVDGRSVWLFPSSFEYIRNHQQNSGGWEGGDVIDEILTTLACLLSLKKHEGVDNKPSGLTESIARAIVFLNECFDKWDVSKTDRVAFEIIVPSMLGLLEREGIEFLFPGRETLFQLKKKSCQNSTLTSCINTLRRCCSRWKGSSE